MTNKLFWENPYLTSLETVVKSVVGDLITLRETIFYALSGGQESDAGTICGYPVIDARKTGSDIEYTIPAGHDLKQGDSVRVEIDWERRYRLMRHHFAAELILELVYRELGEVEKIGAHIAPDKARIDFLWPTNISPLFPKLISQARSLIDQDIEIISAFSDESSQRRYWEVPGFARVSCGGTHLKRTGELGEITLKRKNIGKGKERIEVVVA
jgi:Ser-tRNA(Ala) deacylase AlaX|nr:MAG: alanyl-tRNA editing protein [Sedimenticola sp.]